MIVVSDTTPLNYLILIDSVHVLPTLFGKVYAPTEVLKELSHVGEEPESGSHVGEEPARVAHCHDAGSD